MSSVHEPLQDVLNALDWQNFQQLRERHLTREPQRDEFRTLSDLRAFQVLYTPPLGLFADVAEETIARCKFSLCYFDAGQVIVDARSHRSGNALLLLIWGETSVFFNVDAPYGTPAPPPQSSGIVIVTGRPGVLHLELEALLAGYDTTKDWLLENRNPHAFASVRANVPSFLLKIEPADLLIEADDANLQRNLARNCALRMVRSTAFHVSLQKSLDEQVRVALWSFVRQHGLVRFDRQFEPEIAGDFAYKVPVPLNLDQFAGYLSALTLQNFDRKKLGRHFQEHGRQPRYAVLKPPPETASKPFRVYLEKSFFGEDSVREDEIDELLRKGLERG